MKIQGDDIEFGGLAEFSTFVSEVGLLGTIRLRAPVTDNSGKILIKEDIPVKPGMIEKLQEMEGQYRATFLVGLDRELLKAIRLHLAETFRQRVKKQGSQLAGYLLDRAPQNSQPFLRNSVQSRALILGLYRTLREQPESCHHLVDLGLLTLGFSLHLPFRRRMMHRYAFLAGLCADLGLTDGTEWRRPPENEQDALNRAQRSAQLVERLGLPSGLAEVIRNHRLAASAPSAESVPSAFAGILEEPPPPPEPPAAQAPDNPADETPLENLTPETQSVVTELLRVARFVQESSQRSEEAGPRQILERLVYNAARGYFAPEIIKPLLPVFREYEESLRRIQHVASVERQCLHPPSAWAYPKPNAAQMLCRNHVYSCPHLVAGWDIHVVAAQEAFGWIGTALSPGNYQKCRLEEQLDPPRGESSGGPSQEPKPVT